jgi:hypothetical protein
LSAAAVRAGTILAKLVNGDGLARSRAHSTAKEERHSEQQSPHFFVSSFLCSHLADV